MSGDGAAAGAEAVAAVAPLLALDAVACDIAGQRIVHDVSFGLAPGELGCLLGPSGCGKTTLLRAIAGFQPVSDGRIALRGVEVSTPTRREPPERRRLGFVFQDLALFPHLTLAGNIAFGLRHLGHAARAARVEAMLGLLGLEGLGARFPHELSGGQQQRVALARSLAPQPDLLLLDEPFSSLDAHLRGSLREELRSLLRRLGTAALLVTHDQDEAFSFSDRIGVMCAGRLAQWDGAFEVYHRPANPFVARFVGEGRLIAGRMRADCAVDTALGRFAVAPGESAREGTIVDVLVRPDDLLPALDDGVPARVAAAAFRGAETLYTLILDDASEVCALFPSHHRHVVGERIRVRPQLEHVVVFPTGG